MNISTLNSVSECFLYSIAIRTLGTSAEKFERLLLSIEDLTIKASEVIVVMPYGYATPSELRGNEKVFFSNKGMLAQRIKGIESASNEYILLLDDDVEFEPEIMEKLILAMSAHNADIAYPINRDLLPKHDRAWLRNLTLQAIPRKKQNVFIHILPTGGYAYLDKDPDTPILAESCPGMLLLVKRSALLAINLNEDLWVDTSPYAFRDDAILSYKAYLNGYKIVAVPGIITNHLCGSTRLDPKRAVYSAYSVGCNNFIFWKVYILKQKNTILLKIVTVGLFALSVVNLGILFMFRSILNKNIFIIDAYLKGTLAGFLKKV